MVRPCIARRSSLPCALLVVASLLAGCVAAPVDAEVGTFNIRYSNPRDGENAWPHRQELVFAVLREGDVWGLQEALPDQIDALRRALPGYTVLARSRDADPATGEACPILFRTANWSLDPDEHGTFWLSSTPEVAGSQGWDAALPRIVTFARLIDRDSGRALYVYNLHLDHRGEQARLESARLLASRVAARRHPDPVVVLGDFNAGPTSAPLRALLESPDVTLVDAWRRAHPGAPERGTFNGWDQLGDVRIDHVLVSEDVVVASCAIDVRRPDGRWPSDHTPVMARLLLRAPE